MARIERWPIAGAFTISRGAKTEAVAVVAQISRGGFTGRGECVPYARYGETPEATLATILAMQDGLGKGLDRRTLQALMPASAARNALDCALLDLEAKSRGLRVWDLLKRPAPRACTTAYTISLGTPDAMAAATAKAAYRPLLKIKLGSDDDAARIAAVRKEAPESELIVDANEAWTPGNLERNLAACEAAGVTLIEQPLPAGQDEALAHIRRPMAVCADESVHDLASLEGLRGPLRRHQHQARQGWRPHRSTGDGRCGSGARPGNHGRLHGCDLAVDGAGDADRPTGPLRRSRWPLAAGRRPRRRPALRRQHGLSA
ncbi:L-alanine-DL-glutamate epimerase-like enolase superfamily enzyme [Nitrobacteraceae bacterium AZCC 2299]